MAEETKAPDTAIVVTIGMESEVPTHIAYFYRIRANGSYRAMLRNSTIPNKFAIEIKPGTTMVSRFLELIHLQSIPPGHISFIETRDYIPHDFNEVEKLKQELPLFTFEQFDIQASKDSFKEPEVITEDNKILSI
jgi:hypothetical protein